MKEKATTLEERRAEAESNRGPFAYQPNRLTLNNMHLHERFIFAVHNNFSFRKIYLNFKLLNLNFIYNFYAWLIVMFYLFVNASV